MLFVGCVIPMPIPSSLFVKEYYYNKNYVVTKECTKNIAREIVKLSDVLYNTNNKLMHLQKKVTLLIHDKNSKNTNHVILIRNNKNEKFIFYISESSNKLELVMSEYFKGSSTSSLDPYGYGYTNTITALESIVLDNCLIK